ncbi:MAG: hypothetical protein ACKVP7_25440 [Hyphomicrobiaceae bacterium]
MSQTTNQQPTGDFYAPINRYKQPGDDKPIFTGTLSKPGHDAKLPFALWAFEYTDKKTGEVKRGFGGSINGVATNKPGLPTRPSATPCATRRRVLPTAALRS